MKNFVEIVKKYDYYDTHTHINSKPLLDTAEQIIEDCKNKKILINAIGTGAEDSLVGFKQAQKYTNVFCTVGFHPEEIKNRYNQAYTVMTHTHFSAEKIKSAGELSDAIDGTSTLSYIIPFLRYHIRIPSNLRKLSERIELELSGTSLQPKSRMQGMSAPKNRPATLSAPHITTPLRKGSASRSARPAASPPTRT